MHTRSFMLLLLLAACESAADQRTEALLKETASNYDTALNDAVFIPPVEPTSEPDPTEDVTEIIVRGCPSEPTNPLLVQAVHAAIRDEKNRSRFAAWKAIDNGVSAVSVDDGTRYSMHANDDGSLSFWEHPQTTTGQKAIETYTDADLDGCLNAGGGGNDPAGKMYFHFLVADVGLDRHPTWQTKYDRAVHALAKRLKIDAATLSPATVR